MTQSSTLTIRPETEREAAFLAQALDYYRTVTQAGKDAPFGQFLNHAEKAAVEGGRELLRSSLESIIQDAIDDIEKKNETRLCPHCQQKMRHRGKSCRNIETAAGTIRPKRLYQECMPCHHLEYSVDEPLGLNPYTVGFRSLALRAGSGNSFEAGAKNMKAFCGLETSHMTIRKLCHEEAAEIQKWYEQSGDVPQDFIAAKGNVEITIDATKVNTLGGWRDMKICLYSKRPLGEGVDISYWDKRNRQMLPDVVSCVGFAAMEDKEAFQKRVNHYRSLLRVGLTGDISTLGDGAEWIWNINHAVFGRTRECVDVFHVLKHLNDTGKVLYGEGSVEYEQWQEETKWAVLAHGFVKIKERLDGLEQALPAGEEAKRESLWRLRGYLENHQDRLCYRERLLEGRAIGSGQVEGACKSMIGKRLKQTGARWSEDRLNEMALLCAVHYSDLWEKYWTQAN